jgi:hypothetical protein
MSQTLITNTSGYSGASGFSGVGMSGFSGSSGVSGFTGTSGVSAQSGTSGTSGVSGLSYSGVSGSSGATFNHSQLQPANSSFTASTTGVMLGFGSTITFTPHWTGKVFVIMTGNNNVPGFGATESMTMLMKYGTGTAPAFNSALTGTSLGPALHSQNNVVRLPIVLTGVATGLSVGTAYWFDIGVTWVTGSYSGAVQAINATIVEV